MSMVAMFCVPKVVGQSAAFYTGSLVPTWSATEIGHMFSYVPAVEIAGGGGQPTAMVPGRIERHSAPWALETLCRLRYLVTHLSSESRHRPTTTSSQGRYLVREAVAKSRLPGGKCLYQASTTPESGGQVLLKLCVHTRQALSLSLPVVRPCDACLSRVWPLHKGPWPSPLDSLVYGVIPQVDT